MWRFNLGSSKEYLEKNREKIRAYNKQYWKNNKEKLKLYKQNHRMEYKEKEQAYAKKYRATHKEERRKYKYRYNGPLVVYTYFDIDKPIYTGRGTSIRALSHKYFSSWWKPDLLLITMTCKDEWEAMEYEGKWGGYYRPIMNKEGNRR